MDDETVLKDDVTRYGLRRLHVMRMGEPVNAANWTWRIAPQSMAGSNSRRWVETEIGMHHLLLTWKVREEVKVPEVGSVVLWWIDIDGGETIRKAADLAACWFSLLHPVLPTKAAVNKLPKAAAGKKLDEPFELVEFLEADWVPEQCVAVW